MKKTIKKTLEAEKVMVMRVIDATKRLLNQIEKKHTSH